MPTLLLQPARGISSGSSVMGDWAWRRRVDPSALADTRLLLCALLSLSLSSENTWRERQQTAGDACLHPSQE